MCLALSMLVACAARIRCSSFFRQRGPLSAVNLLIILATVLVLLLAVSCLSALMTGYKTIFIAPSGRHILLNMDYPESPPAYTTAATWRISRERPPGTKARRKGTKARSWSEAEEQYLIQSRRHRIQYKGIAARLQKSELACRLHYHQLTKTQPSTEAEIYGSDNHDSAVKVGPPASSVLPPTTHSATASPPIHPRLSPPTKLPSLATMIGEHQSSFSLQGSLQAPLPSQQPCRPGYILPPPRGLRSPFDEARLSPRSGDEMPSRLPSLGISWNHHNPQRPASVDGRVEPCPLASNSVQALSPMSSSLTIPIAVPSPVISSTHRCSVHSLLDQREE